MRPPLQVASFVNDTITDPHEIPDVRVFVGFLGESSRGTLGALTSLVSAGLATQLSDAPSGFEGMAAVAMAARNAVVGAVATHGGAADVANQTAAANDVDAAAAAAAAAVPAADIARRAGADKVAAAAHDVAAAGGFPTVGDAAERVANAAENAVLDEYSRLLAITQAQRERWVRLYFTLDFKEYVDVRDADIVYNERTSSQLLQRQATILWVRSDAQIWYVRMYSQPVQASDFLRGPLAQDAQQIVRPVLARDIGIQEDPPSWGIGC